MSIKVAGLAGYAKTVRQKEMLATAMNSHGAALRSINTALSYPTADVKEATLAAIILVAMYEIMVALKQTGMKNCSKHLTGQ